MPGYWLLIYFFNSDIENQIDGFSEVWLLLFYICVKGPTWCMFYKIDERRAKWQVDGYGLSIWTMCFHFAFSVQTYAT